jgi:oxygen-independent coproporphyrinogen-3 oxidase
MEEDRQAELMQDAYDLTRAAGLERYEVSNYARTGFECRHNMNYWRGGDYMAVGCGAHGHRQGNRWWNERDAKNTSN